MSRLGWAVAALAAGCLGVNIGVALSDAPTHATLPIFVPVTLEMERAMRAQRDQPVGRGGEEAVRLAQALLEVELDAPTAAAVGPRLESLRALRARLLDARDRRHGLNIALMDVGVRVGTELDPDQWAAVHMRRDALRKDGDDAVFERLRIRLGGATVP